MQNNNWFTEECRKCGTAFSLEVKDVLHEEQTSFQNIAIYSTKSFGNLMVIDGFIMLTERDNFIYHEMLTHPALFSHPQPINVLIVGGGDCGTLREVLKHQCVKNITQVEIDQRVTELSKKFFPQLCVSNHDPRVQFVFDDAIKWIKNVADESVDLIIVDSTDPIGPAKGLFSTPFHKDCMRVLKYNGLIVQQSESPLIHLESIIQPMHQCMRSAGFNHVQLIHFPIATYPTGWWTATIASKNSKITFSREAEVKNLQFLTHYYNHSIHNACFATPEFVKTNLNYD